MSQRMMCGGRLLAGVMAACAMMAGPAPGQDEVDAVEVLRQADAALRAAPGVRYRAVSEGVGSMVGEAPGGEVVVTLGRVDDGAEATLGYRVRVEGERQVAGGERVAVLASFDGKQARVADAPAREVIEGAGTEATDALRDQTAYAIEWLMRWDELVKAPFLDKEAAIPPRAATIVEVDGVACHAIFVDVSVLSSVREYGVWWYIGVEDHLPRRVEALFFQSRGFEEFGDGFKRVTLKDLEVIEPLADDSQFSIQTPDGYEVRTIEQQQARGGARPQPASLVGKAAPDFTLADPSGKQHTLSDYRGQVVVLDFWAIWCGPCKQAMPGLQKLHEHYAGKPVKIFGVNAWENGDPAAFMKGKGFDYGLLLEGDQVAGAYGVSSIPAFFVIGTDGTVIHSAVGFSPNGEVELQRVIDEHLASQAN